MADRKTHRRMSSAEQARLSESRYGTGAASDLMPSDTRSGRRSSGSHAPARHSRAEGVEAYSKRRRKKSRGRALRIVLVSLLLVLAGVGTAAGLYLADINSRLSGNVTDDLRQKLVAVEPQEPFYMLLLGVDKSEGRSGEWGDSYANFRSDTIILTRVDPPAQKVTLVSIPRDTLVDMGEHGEQKINSAYSFGGPSYITEVVSDFAGVEISHYAEIDFEQFTSIVDTIGGVEVTLPKAVHDELAEIDLPAGTQVINGAQALGLCRARHAYDEYGGGDFFRAANQRMVIASIVKKVLKLDPFSITGTISELAGSVTTDLSVTDILSLAGQFMNLDTDNDIDSGQTPTISEQIGGIWYERPDEAAWKEMMERVEAGKTPYSDPSQDFTAGIAGSVGNGTQADDADSDTSDDKKTVEPVFEGSVLALNGASVSGLAGNKATVLKGAGFTAAADNARESGVTTSKIYYNTGKEAAALGVAQTLGIDKANVSQNDGTYSTDYDVVVVLGTDQA